MTAGRRLSADLRLVSACLVWPPSDARTQAILAAARDPALDWRRVQAAVARHRVAGLVLNGLTVSAANAPGPLLEALGRRARQDALQNLAFATEAVRLVGLLRQADIPVQVLKGPCLMMIAYGDLAIRQSRDLDLLVPVDHIARAVEICEQAGYGHLDAPPAPDAPAMGLWLRLRKDFVLRSTTRKTILELHFRATHSHHLARQLDLQAEQGEVEISPGHALPTATGDALYAYLCVHGAYHAWARLKWLGDIAALTSRLTDPEIVALHAAAGRRGAGRASGQALLLMELFFGRRLPTALERGVRGDWKVRRLTALATDVLLDPREADTVPFRSTLTGLSHLLLDDSWAFRLEEIGSWLVDWSLVARLNLPRPLWFLYPLLRGPVWLANKATGLLRRRATR